MKKILIILLVSSGPIAFSQETHTIPQKYSTALPSEYPLGVYIMNSESGAPYNWPIDAAAIFGFKPSHSNYRHSQFIVRGENFRMRTKDGSSDAWGDWRHILTTDTSGALSTLSWINARQYIAISKNGSYRVAMNGQGDGYITGRNDLVENKFLIHSNGSSWFNGGNVGIGTSLSSNPNNYKLAVNGTIGAKEVVVESSSTTWPDYVFEEDYSLMPLIDLEPYLKKYKHLPGIPTAAEIEEKGQSLGEMNSLLLKKVEELTLYVIQLEEKNEHLEADKKEILKRLSKLEELLK